MNAIEFIADAEDGSIKIPRQYRNALKKQFRVIILLEDEIKEPKQLKKRKLSAVKLKTKGFKFDRDEANKR